MNINCVICSDSFVSADNIFTTPCGHIFHHVCLMNWFERSKSCPQCRSKCTERNIFRIYFNNNVNLDSTQTNASNLIEKVDNMTLQIREKDLALKTAREERLKLEETLTAKEKNIEKLDTSVSRNNQIIATMRHEMDILSSHRTSIKAVEQENAVLKSKLELMVSIESVLTASQSEVDVILKQNLGVRELSVMVGTLRRELNSNEVRKNELRKQLDMIKSDLRAERQERRKVEEKLSSLDSENHSLRSRLRRIVKSESDAPEICEIVESSDVDSPEPAKRPRLALKYMNELNTPSPLTQDEFQRRVEKVKTSDSPYLKVKSSSIAFTSVLKKPLQMKEHSGLLARSKSSEALGALSIFRKPGLAATSNAKLSLKSENVVYNGIGSTTKVLQSDLKTTTTEPTWFSSSKTNVVKKKKLSPLALGN